MTTMYGEIIRVMSDGKPRTAREIATEIAPEQSNADLMFMTSKISSIVSRKARVWGEFEVEGMTTNHGRPTRIWRMVR